MRKHAKYTYQSQFLEMFGNPQTCSSGVVGKDVFEFASGKALTKENLNPEYEYNCYGGNGVTGKSNDYLVEASTIVIGRVGEYCGGIHLTNPYSWITDNAIYLKKYDSRYELEFIEYLFKAMDFHRFASESGQPKITQSPLIESVYPLPSKDEQIAFLIIKRQADKSKFDGFKSQFLEMFGEEAKWKIMPLKDIVHVDCPISYGIVQPGDDLEDGISIVRPVDMTSDLYIGKDGLKKTSKAISESYRRTILRGDEILLCVRGTTGLVNLAKSELAGCNVTRGITPLYFKDNINPRYVYCVLTSPKAQQYIADHTHGSTLKGINMEDVRNLPIPIPSLEVQNQCESILIQADKSKFELRKAISAIDEVIKSLING